MRQAILLQITVLWLLGSVQAMATEGEYPAAHFEPQVIYQAADTVASDTAVPVDGTVDVDYPAAHFVPEVIYQDPDLISKTGPLAESGGRIQAPLSTPPKIAARNVAPSAGGRVSDSSPPYGALILAVAVVGLAFWWSTRQAPQTLMAERGSEPETEKGEGEETEDTGEVAEADTEEDPLEFLEEEVALATSNRQRANKSKRTRRP